MKRQKLLKNLKCRGNLLALLLTLVASLFTYTSAWAETSLASNKDLYLKGGFNNWDESFKLTTDNSNEFSGTFYIAAQSAQYSHKLYQDGKWYSYGNYLFKSDVTGPAKVWKDAQGGDDKLQTINQSGYIKIAVKAYVSYNIDDGTYSVYSITQTKVTEMTKPTISLSASQGTVNQPVTITASVSNGTGSFTYKFYDGSTLLATQTSNEYVYTPTTVGTHALKVTVTDKNISAWSKTSDVTNYEATSAGSAPTVLIGAQAEDGATANHYNLYGYLKFTGCQNVTDFGFIWSDTEANISADTPTGTSVQATSPVAPITVGNEGTEFALSDYLFQTSATKIYYKAYATNTVGTSYSNDYRELSITGCVKPAKPENITGDATACKTIASAYSVAAVATATSYKWSLPEGWSITSGSGTNSITATPGDDAVTGNIKVCATNECGDGEYSNDFAVTVNPLADAGTVSLSNNSICDGDAAPTVQVEGNVLGGGTGAWSSSNTAVATINADGTNLEIVGVGSTSITYTITGGCGGTKSADASLTVNAVPEPGTVSATETTICADGTSTLSAQGTTAGVSYQWQKSTTSEITGFEDITGATEQTYIISGLAAGTYWFRLKVTNDAGCNDISDAEQITVNANPSITLAGSGDKSAAATTPWEYMTITATTDLTPAWSLTTPTGFEEDTDYVVEKTDAKTYKLKSKLTDNPDTDKFTVSATVTDSSCSTTATYDVYINAAAAEICN